MPVTTPRSNGLPALRDLPIKFTRRAATAELAKIIGKETDHAKHSPHEYASEDGRWIIRSMLHNGHGSTNGGRVRWHVIHDGRYFAVGFGSSGGYAHSLEDAIDEIHRKITRGLRDGFEVLARMRKDSEDRDHAQVRRAANLVRAKDLLGRVYGADQSRLIEQLAAHVNLDALARAIEAAGQPKEELP